MQRYVAGRSVKDPMKMWRAYAQGFSATLRGYRRGYCSSTLTRWGVSTWSARTASRAGPAGLNPTPLIAPR
jgi:hypothetical protein